MFKGSITALITPFDTNGDIDWPAYENLIEWQIEQGIHGLVPCGTTGETPTISHAEHKELVKRCIEITNKRVPVIAGAGSNSTAEALELTQEAKKDGADAVLVTTPYYNKPTQEGLYAHYKALNDEGDIPVVLYNVPGRSVIDMTNDTIAKLAELPNIVGIKDATADLERPLDLRNKVGEDFCILCGENSTYTAFLAQGGHGGILVTSNIAPKECASAYEAWVEGDLKTVAHLRDLLGPLHIGLFSESSPSPAKYATSLLGLTTDNVRLPLLPASKKCRAVIDDAMEHAGLLANKPTAKTVNG